MQVLRITTARISGILNESCSDMSCGVDIEGYRIKTALRCFDKDKTLNG
jgi:hypothetical protein